MYGDEENREKDCNVKIGIREPDKTENEKKRQIIQPRRKEIWFANLGSIDETNDSYVIKGIRPVVVISNDHNNYNAGTVVVVPMTTKFKRLDLPTHVLIEDSDIDRERQDIPFGPSMVICEQILTIDKSDFLTHVGYVWSREVWREIERGIAVETGLACPSLTSRNGNDLVLPDEKEYEHSDYNHSLKCAGDTDAL